MIYKLRFVPPVFYSSICEHATMFNSKSFPILALALFATLSLASPLVRREAAPSGALQGLAQWSDFDGTSACGTQISADQAIVGIDGSLFNSIDEACGRTITISAPNGVKHQAVIQESCGDGVCRSFQKDKSGRADTYFYPQCGENGLLLTTSLFSDFYSLDKGTFQASWSFD